MAPDEVRWGPALVVLGAGLLLGLALILRLRRSKRIEAPAAPLLELRDLDGRIESLLHQLRELEDTAAKRTPEQLAEERYALELEAARTLQARERLAPARPASRRKAGRTEPARVGRRALLWALGSTAAVAALVGLAWRTARPRPEGGSVTGNVAGEASRGNDLEADLRAAIRRDPDDLDARLDLARLLVGKRDLMGVWNETQYVLSRSPGHPRAQAYEALVRLAMGQGEVAVTMLRQAVTADPDLLEAHENLAYAYARLGRMREAETAVAETSRRFPAEGERLRRALARFNATAGGPAAPER